MKLDVELLDTSINIRTMVSKNKESILEMYVFFPQDMSIKERGIDANVFLNSKSSNYYYSISKAKNTLLKLKAKIPEKKSDFPIFLKAFKLRLSEVIRDVNTGKIKDIDFVIVAKSLLSNLRSAPTSQFNLNDFRSTDELCSYHAEQMALIYFYKSNKSKSDKLIPEEIFDFFESERKYREKTYGLKYNEAQYMRKKEDCFCNNIKLSQKNRVLGAVREQIVFSISAFLSMFFTTLIVFYFQMGYGTFSFVVLMAFCVSYILKDRFKELFRNYVFVKLSKGKFSIKSTLIDSDNNVIASCYDLSEFRFPDEDVLKIRNIDEKIKNDDAETVIYYKKKYKTNNNFSDGFSRIQDSMTINLSSLLEFLPDVTLKYATFKKGNVVKKKFPMFYDLNIVIRLNENKIERYKFKVSHTNIENMDQLM
jgi:hypothetical protein